MQMEKGEKGRGGEVTGVTPPSDPSSSTAVNLPFSSLTLFILRWEWHPAHKISRFDSPQGSPENSRLYINCMFIRLRNLTDDLLAAHENYSSTSFVPQSSADIGLYIHRQCKTLKWNADASFVFQRDKSQAMESNLITKNRDINRYSKPNTKRIIPRIYSRLFLVPIALRRRRNILIEILCNFLKSS